MRKADAVGVLKFGEAAVDVGKITQNRGLGLARSGCLEPK